jgi:hypothetical protein
VKNIALISLLACVALNCVAQANFVKNPSFEDTVKCPDEINEIGRAKYWTCAVDTAGNIDGLQYYAPEYYNACAGVASPVICGVPQNAFSYQYPHFGNAYIGAGLYYDKTPPPPAGATAIWRDYAQGHLHKPLQNGKAYCISFWVVLTETSGYAHNKIGAYLDNGNINKRSPAGIEITDVIPQFQTTSIVKDTMNWVKVEGSFIANGTETHITLGNFAKQADVDTAFLYWGGLYQYSYYLIDDVSVIPIDLAAEAGKDTWVEMGKKVQIGRVGDTTAQGLDCKWYKKGALIDSGAIITVNSNSIINKVDTYVVVQNICGVIKRDTVNVKTTNVGIKEMSFENAFSFYPNPSNGNFSITCFAIPKESITAKVYDLLGRMVHQEPLNFNNKEATLKLNIPSGSYILELKDEAGNVQRERIVIE